MESLRISNKDARKSILADVGLSETKRHVLFVCYTNFLSNSAIQMFHLANALVALGNQVTCAIPAPTSTVRNCGTARFNVLTWDEVLQPEIQARTFTNPPDVVHAWTPREGVRKIVEALCQTYHCPHMVHLEDNEDYVFSAVTGVAYDDILRHPESDYESLTRDGLSHPYQSRRFLAASAGVTLLIDKLSEFVAPETPHLVFYPSCDESAFYARPIDYERRRSLGIADDDFLLTYNGNAHIANVVDMRGLYVAVGLCNQQGGRRVKLLRLGVTDDVDLYGGARDLIEPHVVDLGSRPHSEQAPNLALADGLVQPGKPDPFNDYRFPSKLPEFFRMAKPIVLPRSNIGLVLRDGEEALVMDRGTTLEMAEKINRLKQDPGLCTNLATAITNFSARFSWANAAGLVNRFYDRQLETAKSTQVQA